MKNSTSKKKTVGILLIIFGVLLLIILFPRRYDLKDGGTSGYENFLFGLVYDIQQRHRITTVQEGTYYEVGTVIYVLGKEIYNNTSIDYNQPISTGRNPDIEEINKSIASIMESREAKANSE